MTQDEIIRMAKEAGLHKMIRHNWKVEVHTETLSPKLERFAALVAEATKEKMNKTIVGFDKYGREMHKLKNEEPNFCKDCVKHLVKDGIHTCSPQLIKAAIEATKEKAAKVCEHNKHRQSSHDDEYATGYVDASLDCAAAIRNMK